jgi:hypothetical protein
MVAGLASGIISTAACLFFGVLLPTWIVGKDTATSSTTGEVFSVTLSFASAYALLAFTLLTLFFYRRLSAEPTSKEKAAHS